VITSVLREPRFWSPQPAAVDRRADLAGAGVLLRRREPGIVSPLLALVLQRTVSWAMPGYDGHGRASASSNGVLSEFRTLGGRGENGHDHGSIAVDVRADEANEEADAATGASMNVGRGRFQRQHR